ncbi:hypothetical protein BDW42DRAFT_22385 [Aspergillus taichungensis]|uniref:Class I glutamine amidotransferase-like protein n=1 Tax=Aspergillus taichungensis TaxID=482145 RepID=A0A2J5HH91_9EURO|nr:hypothetical protein BDW42DRAFT_22385 [Aspergillus taichungensis]
MTPPPTILLISLNLEPYFDELYTPQIDLLTKHATLQRTQTTDATLRTLTSPTPPHAVLLTDAALTQQKHVDTWDAVLQYVRNGGTAICMGHFTSFIKPPRFVPFFSRAGLAWDMEEYMRTTVCLQRRNCPDRYWGPVPDRYSQKAVFLKNVDPGDVWYRTGAESVRGMDGAAVALARVGEGRLGYIGDVNAEVDSGRVLVALCGL